MQNNIFLTKREQVGNMGKVSCVRTEGTPSGERMKTMDHELVLDHKLTELVPDAKEPTIALVLALIVDLIGAVAAGRTLNGQIAEMLPTLAAVATPGILAWVMAYLAFNTTVDVADDEEYEEAIIHE